jgi:hypothetical protein
MSALYVTEFESITPTTEGGAAQVARAPAVVDQTPVTISGTSAQSAAFGKSTKYVRLHSDVICSVSFGANPTASTNNMRFAANQTEYFGVTPGMKVAVISNV